MLLRAYNRINCVHVVEIKTNRGVRLLCNLWKSDIILCLRNNARARNTAIKSTFYFFRPARRNNTVFNAWVQHNILYAHVQVQCRR